MAERYSDYDHWAWLYNLTAGPKYSRYKLEVLKRVLLPKVPAGGRLLDLCCGTGQLIQSLQGQGYRITGLDGSAAMLDYARANAPEAEFILADARAFSVTDKFHGAFCTSASLNHIPTLADLEQVFLRVSESLLPGGPFVFDMNHPAQMRRHWRGQPGEGEIRPDYAWLITPHYDDSRSIGRFEVDIYQAPEGQPAPALKRLLGSLLSRRHLTRSRLRLLQRFHRFQPQWRHSELSYTVYGHDLDAVAALLAGCGFGDVSIQTVDGDTGVSENRSAYFVCVKNRDRRHGGSARATEAVPAL